MKTLNVTEIFLIPLFLMPRSTIAQSNTIADSVKVLYAVQENPEFRGGDSALINFIRENINYLEAAKSEGIEGDVIVSFIVDSLGVVSNIAVRRGIHPLLDEEALRIVRKFPNWSPGRHDGKNVSTILTIPIRFELSNN